MNAGDGKRFVRRLGDWYPGVARDLPWRRTSDPYRILVSEVMLQQTQVATVTGYYTRWLKKFPDVHALADAGEEDVLRAWEGLGYYSRARNLHKAVAEISRRYEGRWPETEEELKKLPGIGPYTAAAVASFAFGAGTAVVDANVARVLARLHNYREPVDLTAGMRGLRNMANALIAHAREPAMHNNAMMELGATICRAGTPDCRHCPVREFCLADSPEELPVKRSRQEITGLEDMCVLAVRDRQVLLEKVTAKRWHGLWRLPALEVRPASSPILETIYHVTRYRVRLQVFAAEAEIGPSENHRWVDLDKLESCPSPSPHRKALRLLNDYILGCQ